MNAAIFGVLGALAVWGVLVLGALNQNGKDRKAAKAGGKDAGPNLTKLLLESMSAFLAGFMKKKPKAKEVKTEDSPGVH